MALLELARGADTNHPGILIFDEPRQQETKHVSFKSLLQRAADAKKHNQQVIFATSDDSDELPKYLKEIPDMQYLSFDGWIVSKLKE